MLQENTIFEKALKVEMKDLFVDLRRNKNGVYIKISERNGMQKNTILFPASGIKQLRDALDEAMQHAPSMKRTSKLRKDRAVDSNLNDRSVYVSGLSWDTTDDDLARHMSTAGEVMSAFIMRRGKKKSMGCGVVEYASRDIALAAIDSMNDTELHGRMVHCREDRRVDEDGHVLDGDSYSKGAGSKEVDAHKIFCQNLSWETSAEVLKAYFGVVGTVVDAEIITSKNGRHLGVGYVEFADAANVRVAIDQLNNQELEGRTITVREYYA